jgi:NAD(P)-dependent dehydrogenase (short-subunit alcohol dehydrogenase family)
MIDVNLRSAFATVRAAIPHLKTAGWGRIVLIGSRAAGESPAGQAAFNAAKAGVAALGMTVAQELDDTAITANVIVPSVIDTPATRKALPFADYINWPTPDEIAAVIDFVLSDASGVISGATIPVYGRT